MKLSCPSADRLREFLEGSVGDAEANHISGHVVECPSCDRVLSTLEGEQGNVLEALREGVRNESLLQEPEFEQLRNTARLGQADTTVLSDVDEHLETGKRLRDYRLVKKIGEGGMGTVYQAVHVHLAKHVALKILPADKLQSRQSVGRFRQEMRAVGKVNHPNVVGASDAGTIDGQHFLVMELVQGADLARIIHDRGPLSVADACEIVRQTAIGLQHAHDNGLVHRDVKPSNIMLALDGNVKLLDLGLAGLNNSEFESTANVVVTDRLTSVGQIMGTLDYMAPEQIAASPLVDNKADIYALGATLFQLLTGRTPCGDRSKGMPERIEAVLHKPPLDIASLRNDVPEELCALLLKMLAKNPDDRPQAAIDVAAELERFASDADLVGLAEVCRTSLDIPSADVDVTDDVSFVVSRTAQPQNEGNARRPLTAVALAGFFMALVAAVVYYIQTNHGVVRVEVSDPSLKVSISDQTITTMEGNKKPLTIRAGEQSLIVREGDSDFVFETDRFQIRRGDKIAFKVERREGEVVVNKNGESFGAKTLPNDLERKGARPSPAATERELNPVALIQRLNEKHGGLKPKLQKLMSEAAGIPNAEWHKFAADSHGSSDAIKGEPLSLVLWKLNPLEASTKKSLKVFQDFQYIGGVPKPRQLSDAMFPSEVYGYYSMIQPHYISELGFDLKRGTNQLTGNFRFQAPNLYAGKIDYVVQIEGDDLEVVEFTLPNYGITIIRDDQGLWKRSKPKVDGNVKEPAGAAAQVKLLDDGRASLDSANEFAEKGDWMAATDADAQRQAQIERDLFSMLRKYPEWDDWKRVSDPVPLLRRVLLPTDFEKLGWQIFTAGAPDKDRVAFWLVAQHALQYDQTRILAHSSRKELSPPLTLNRIWIQGSDPW